MALESLNRYIKREKLKDNGNIRLEKLLNVLEEVVDDKMWKRIITLKRPNRNSYQGRAVVLAHKKKGMGILTLSLPKTISIIMFYTKNRVCILIAVKCFVKHVRCAFISISVNVLNIL